MLSVARSRILCSGVMIFALMLCAPFAFAGTVDIFSSTTGTNNQTGTDIAIPVSPAWAPSGPGYEWISYGNTGCNTFVALTGRCTPGPQNPAGASGPLTSSNITATFYQTFTVTDTFDSGTLNV